MCYGHGEGGRRGIDNLEGFQLVGIDIVVCTLNLVDVDQYWGAADDDTSKLKSCLP